MAAKAGFATVLKEILVMSACLSARDMPDLDFYE